MERRLERQLAPLDVGWGGGSSAISHPPSTLLPHTSSHIYPPRDALKAEVNPTLDANDGLFWMSFEDFCKHFQRVDICHTHSHAGARWLDCRHKGLVRYTDHGVTCPYFKLRVSRPTEAWISLHQDDERVLHAQPYIDLDFVLYREESDGERTVVKSIHGKWDRQTQVGEGGGKREREQGERGWR